MTRLIHLSRNNQSTTISPPDTEAKYTEEHFVNNLSQFSNRFYIPRDQFSLTSRIWVEAGPTDEREKDETELWTQRKKKQKPSFCVHLVFDMFHNAVKERKRRKKIAIESQRMVRTRNVAFDMDRQ